MKAADYTVTCGEGTAVYDPGANTLTLENATIDVPKLLSSAGTAGIVTDGYLNIQLKGTNVINTRANHPSASAVWGDQGVRIEGIDGGSLKCTSRIQAWDSYKIEMINANITVEDDKNIAIWAKNGTVVIQNSHVTATGIDGGVKGEAGIQISANSVVDAKGTNLTTKRSGISSNGDIIIADSEVTAEGTQHGIVGSSIQIDRSVMKEAVGGGSCGIYATASLKIENASEVEAKGADFGIYGSEIQINSSVVEATGTGTTSQGMCASSETGSLRIENGSHVTVIGSYYGLLGNGSLVITGSTVKAEGTSALYGKKGMTVSPAPGSLVEVKYQTDAGEVKHWENSPSDTDIVINPADFKSYFQSKTHVHTGGTELCDKGKVCDDCGQEYSQAPGHNWGEITYTWSNDGKSCTAKRICKTDQTHEETANAAATGVKTKEPTCTEFGEITYTADFLVDWADPQQKVMADIPKMEHRFKWVIVKEAAVGVPGSKYEECEVCSYQKEAVEIPALSGPSNPGETVDPKYLSNGNKNVEVRKGSLQTGDGASLVFWFSLMIFAGAGAARIVLYRSRRNECR